MSRIVLVSNRVSDLSRGTVQAGGVAVLLAEVLEKGPSLWFGWNGKIEDGTAAEVSSGSAGELGRKKGASARVVAVPLTADEHADYYLAIRTPFFGPCSTTGWISRGSMPVFIAVTSKSTSALQANSRGISSRTTLSGCTTSTSFPSHRC